MLKPTFFNILISILVKWIVFYFILFSIYENYNPVNITGIADLFGIILGYIIIGGLPVLIELILFSFPMYFSFFLKMKIPFIIINIFLFLGDYFLYIFGTSKQYFRDVNGVYLLICAFSLFFIFFFKAIVKILAKRNLWDERQNRHEAI